MEQSNIPITLALIVDCLQHIVPVAIQEKFKGCVCRRSWELHFGDDFVYCTSEARCLTFACTSLKRIDIKRYKTHVAIYVKWIMEKRRRN